VTRKRARLYLVLLLLATTGGAVTLALTALKSNVSYFRTPTEVATGAFPEKTKGRGFRLGGMVEQGSVTRAGAALNFRVTDYKNSVTIHYEGAVPDLFREGQGVVAEGKLDGMGVFQARTLLAKHDEKYMPPEIKAIMQNVPTAGSRP
jgi:cytochrome c-type biogenesis protein CcmE